MKNTHFYTTQSYIKAILIGLGLFGMGLVICIASASAVAPKAQDNASQRGIERSNPRSTWGGSTPPSTAATMTTTTAYVQAVALRKDRCEASRKTILQKVKDYSSSAQVYERQLDEALDSLVSIKQDLHLNSPDVEALLDTARMIQRDNVRPAVGALVNSEAVQQLDCNSSEVASTVKAFRDTTLSAKDALIDYRQAIKAAALAMQDITKVTNR
ncbi:MAG: hypothetical protein WBO35_00250 [Candidatus Saccharimonadales bacterium]